MGAEQAFTSTAMTPASTSTLSKFSSAATSVAGMMTAFSGISSWSASKTEADLQEQQAALAQEEAYQTALQKQREVRKAAATQGSTYNSSGVTLEGTPLLVLAETRNLGQQEINAIMKRGAAQAELLTAKAQATRNAGRASMFSSLTKAGTTTLNNQVNSRRAGLFGNKYTSPSEAAGDDWMDLRK